jgi:hypothetical protein
MWATLAVATTVTLAAAEPGQLAIKNDRVTYGVLGQERKDAKFLPGDMFIVSFDIEGLKLKEDGRVLYSIGVDLLNKKGESQFKKTDAEELEVLNALGGSTVPAFALAEIGTDTPAGEYTLKVTVKDRSTMKTTELTRKFEVAAREFGFVRLNLTYPGGNPAPPVAVPGQTYMLNFFVVGFELDKSNQPNIGVEMSILGPDGKPTLPKPFTGSVTMVDDARKEFKKYIPMQFVLPLNRPGKFTIELKATDVNNKNKSVKQTLEFEVR